MLIDRRKFAWQRAIYPGIAIILLAIIAWQRVAYQPPVPQNNVSTPARIAPEVKRETTAATPIKTGSIQTYRPAMKAKLKLPDSVIHDDAQAVIAASQVKPSDHPQTVTTVVNTDTGETETYVKEDPLPWLAANTTTEISGALLTGNRGEYLRGEIRQEIFQSKAMHFSGIVTGRQPLSGQGGAEAAVGITMALRF